MTDSAATHLEVRAKAAWLLAAAAAGLAIGLLATRVTTPQVVLVAVVGLVAVAVIVADPELGLLALGFITFLNLSGVLARRLPGPSLMDLLIPLMALALLARWIGRRAPPRGWRRPVLLVAAPGLAGVLSLLAARDPSSTLAGLVELAKDGVVAVLVVTLLQHGATLRRLLWSLLAAGLVMGTISVHQHLTGNFGFDYWGLAAEPVTFAASTQQEHRVAGPIGNPNYYGLILVVLIPIAIDRLTCGGKLVPRVLALWALVVCTLSIVFTYSRGAFVALLAMLGFLWIVRRPRPRNVFGVIVLAALLSPLVPRSYFERMWTLVSAVGQPAAAIGLHDVSMRGRLSENLVAVRMFLDHPIIGIGMDNYQQRYQDYSQQLMLDPRSEERAPHNLYLEVAAETGIIGLLALGVVLWALFRSILIARRSLHDPELAEIRGMVDAVAIALVGFLVGSLFLHASHTHYFWLLAAICLALPRVAATEVAARAAVSDNSSPHRGQ